MVALVASLGGAGYLFVFIPRSNIANVSLSEATTTLDQGQKITVTAAVVDPKGLNQAEKAALTWVASPADALQVTATGVGYTVEVRALKPGNATLSAKATYLGSSKSSEVAFTIRALHFGIDASKVDPVVGEPIVLTVTALRSDSTPAKGYTDTVTLSADDATAISFPLSRGVFSSSDFGRRAFPGVVIQKPGPVHVFVTDTVAPIKGNATLLGDQRPVPDFTINPTPNDPMKIALDGGGSFDPDSGDAVTAYEWDFGDESLPLAGRTATHEYTTPGAYAITLSVKDTHQASNKTMRPYTALAPPVARFLMVPMVNITNASQHIEGIQALAFATGSYDPDGSIVKYTWAWGDETSDVTVLPWALHTYELKTENKTVRIGLVVKDDDGLTATFGRTVKVTPEHLPPLSSFSISYVDALNLEVRVDGSPSTDLNGDLISYDWSWGDGSWTNKSWPNANSTHTYELKGNYTIGLTVVDSTGLTNTTWAAVTVIAPPLPPKAAFTIERTQLHVRVDGSQSSDPNKDIATYAWDWGDAKQTAPSNEPTASHDYAAAGVYSLTLTVTDATHQQAKKSRWASLADTTLDYTYYDFFKFPYGEWWDYRTAIYGDRAINAECFNRTSIADGVCTPLNPNVPDYETYPYTDWYPLPGSLGWDSTSNNPMIYAPYRFKVTGANVPGYNLSEPVFLPVLNYGEPSGSRLDFNWKFQYLDKATGDALAAIGCAVDSSNFDGFYGRSQVDLTMDVQESKRIFGVKATDAASAKAWWSANADDACYAESSSERTLEDWFYAMGGSNKAIGKYDITNSFEWYYQPFYTQVTASVDADGTTHVSIDTAAWGTEVLLTRMFYWGNVSYAKNYLDSTKARGWWGMELAWFEDMNFKGSLGQVNFNFNLTSVMEYHFQQLSLPGPDGRLDRKGDIPYWTWGPILSDYTNDYNPVHTLSELDRYPSPPYNYVHSTPGGTTYGRNKPYDYAPIRWDLALGQAWHFQFPKGNVVSYDPNLTPVPANPNGAASGPQFVTISSPLSYLATNPTGYGTWDAQAITWEVNGPATTGGPSGAPGNYALEPWGAIKLIPSQLLPS